MHTRTGSLLAAALVACLAGNPGLLAQAPQVAPGRQTLVLPIFATPPGAQPARSLDCAVPFGPALPIGAAAFSPDAKLLATGAYQEVLLWDLAEAKLLKRLGVGQLGDMVQAVAFRNDGRLLAVAEGAPHGPGSVKLLDVQSGQVAAAFAEPKDVIYSLAFSPDGKLLAAAGVDTAVYVWSVDEKKNLTVMKGHSDWILGLSFSPDGKLLASAGPDKSVLVWEVGTWKRAATVQESLSIHGVAFNPDGQLLALAVAGSEEKAIHIRRRTNNELVRSIDLGIAAPLDVTWLAQGNRICVPSSDKLVRVYDAGNGGLVATLTGHANWVYRVAATPDGSRLASASADGTVKLWLAAEGRLLATLAQLTPRTEEWLIITPPGYLATSSPGAIQWRAAGLKTPPDKLLGMLANPDLVKQAIGGAKLSSPAIP